MNTILLRILFLHIILTTASLINAQETESPRPPFTDDTPAAGKFVKQTADEYRDTNVYHGLYLPRNWQPGKTYPVIVEYAPNKYPQGNVSGKVDDCRMGYWLSAGQDFIWVVMPYVNTEKKENQIQWWGSETATVTYCVTNLKRICEQFGGDPNAIFITGFSRGAIACGYIGLRDDSIADIWLGFIPHSHIDGGRFTVPGSRERLARIKGRPTFITYGSDDNGKPESLKGVTFLTDLKFPVTQRELKGVGHADTWLEADSPTRRDMRDWITSVLKNRPGTNTVQGRVLTATGQPLEGVKVQCGPWHWSVTDASGNYKIPSLVPGTRTLTATKPGITFTPATQEITLTDSNVTASDFKSAP
ncbi:MAG: carboxypeptidase regulatory-like domain-containing protein [Planctomycetota bacterium]